MNEQECLSKMVAPGNYRPGKYRGGVIQILVTSQCDKACINCTQGSQLTTQGRSVMTPSQFEDSLESLGFKSGMGNGPVERGTDNEYRETYWGVCGVFGGNPALSSHFHEYCYLLQEYVPWEQRGIWCNNPLGKGKIMRETFNSRVSNLNVHLDAKAYDEFKRDWPESLPFGLTGDSRHSPPFVAMKDVLRIRCPSCDGGGRDQRESCYGNCPICNGTGEVYDEGKAWELISKCDINQHWSALIGVFRGELRAWFCEVAGAQAMLHQYEGDSPDTGLPVTEGWWKKGMEEFREQVRVHCHSCGVPLRGYGELSQSLNGKEQVSKIHAGVYKPKRKDRKVELVTDLIQLDTGRLNNMTRYIQNAKVC